MPTERRDFPTGMSIVRELSETGEVLGETHSYGPRVGISYQFSRGVKTSEVYVVKGRPASAQKYEAERQLFPDLPAAGAASDALATLKRVEKEARRSPAPKAARTATRASVDSSCSVLLSRECLDGHGFVFTGYSGLGERDAAESNAVLRRLRELGARGIYLCRIERTPEALLVGCLVVRLPEAEGRLRLLKYLDDVARADGVEAGCSIGNEFAQVSLK